MMRTLLLPEKIGSYYLLPKDVCSIEIQNNSCFAATIRLSGRQATVRQWISEAVSEEELAREDGIVEALRRLKQKVGTNSFILNIPTPAVFFKELSLPFTDHEQLELVLPFELEPLLPFTIDQALFDFVVTSQDHALKQSRLLVAVAQRETISQYEDLCHKAGIELEAIAVDILSILNIARSTSLLSQQPATLMLALYNNAVTAAIIQNGQLVSVRSLNKGISQLLRNIALATKSSFNSFISTAAQEGISQDLLERHDIQDFVDDFFNEISFFIQPFLTQGLQQIIVAYNTPYSIANLEQIIAQKFSCSVHTISMVDLKEIKNLSLEVQSLDYRAPSVVGAALPAENHAVCNLLQAQARLRETDRLGYQVLVALMLGILAIGSIVFYSMRARAAATDKINKARQSLQQKMRNDFHIQSRSLTVDKLLETAERNIEQEGNLWFALSGKRRPSYLRSLYELTAAVDRETTQLHIKRLQMTEKQMLISGSVPGYPELRTLENELGRSSYFTLKTIPQEPQFDLTLLIPENNQ